MWLFISSVGLGFGYLVYPVGYTISQNVNANSEYIRVHEEYTKRVIGEAEEERMVQSKQLQKILEYLEKDYYISGMGSVGTFGGGESYVRINRRSDASIYKDGDRIRITCDIEGKPEAVLRVNGTFTDSNQDLLISFSRQAADDLGVASRVEVELKPAEK